MSENVVALPGVTPLDESNEVARKVIPLGNITRLDLPTERVLDGAKEHCTDGVVVLGFDDDGELYFASSIADGGSVIWLLEKAKKALLETGDE